MLSNPLLQENLNTKYVGRHIEDYNQLVSTNSEAWKLLNKGARKGTLVFTDNQKGGKGRGARTWYSSPERSLTFSIILYPELNSLSLGWYPLLAGLSIIEALSRFNLSANLKWPNDLSIKGEKLAGILCESKIKGKRIRALVMGIGLNVNEIKQDFPPELEGSVTSMLLASHQFFRREKVLAEILNSLEMHLDQFQTNGPDKIRSKWLHYCHHLNSIISFHRGNKTVTGKFLGLGPNGEARLLIKNEEVLFSSGEVA